MHAEAPAAAAYAPVPQLAQTEEVVAPVVAEKVPAGQLVQADAPVPVW